VHDLTPAQKAAAEKAEARAMDAAGEMIRLRGYDCREVDYIIPLVWHEGYTVTCNNHRYHFTLQNHGGKWSVTSND
jgi:hypothetical protein